MFDLDYTRTKVLVEGECLMKNKDFNKDFQDELYGSEEICASKEDYLLVKGIVVLTAVVVLFSFLGF